AEDGRATSSAAYRYNLNILHGLAPLGKYPGVQLMLYQMPHPFISKWANAENDFRPEARSFMRIGKYESSESSSAGTAVVFLLIGLGAGALAGLLLAPKTGKQLRRDLRRGYEDAKDAIDDWTDEAKERVMDARERVRDAASRGIDLAEDLRDAARDKVEPLRRATNRG